MVFPRLLKPCFLFALVISCQALCLGAEHSFGLPPDPAGLLFLTWAEYIDPNVVQEFERKFNARVREIHFETDDARDDMLVETDGSGYDVVVVNTAALPLYRKRRWLAPINIAELPNLKHIDARWMNAVPQAVGYGVPSFWGTTGIGYRADLISEKITSWWQLFQPSETLRGKIIMIKNARNVIGMALKALGYSTNSTNLRKLEEAEQLLLAQKPSVKSYSYVSLGKDLELLSGQA